MPTAVLLNPYQPYALGMIARLWRDHGVRTVALHSDWRIRFILEGRAPILRSSAVAAHYMVALPDLDPVVKVLRARADVVAVVPHDEGAVLPLARIAEELQLDWAQPLVQTFRNKGELKSLLAAAEETLRINANVRVTSADEVANWRRAHGIGRFVLKPNDGSGNVNVAILDADVSDAEVAAYFESASGVVLAEEFIDGDEYWVDGQIDAAGKVAVTGIGRYQRGPANGRTNLEFGAAAVPTTERNFAALRDYATAVMSASGLRRSPFHLEAIVDDSGPCLVEVGARLCGDLLSYAESWQHGSDCDLVGQALRQYLPDPPPPELNLDWQHYDSHLYMQVNGVQEHRIMVGEVVGFDVVEADPSFLFWIKQPQPGDVLLPTDGLVTKPWSVVLRGADETALVRNEEFVRSTLQVLPSDATGPRARVQLARRRFGKMWSSRPRLYEFKPLLAQRSAALRSR